MTIANPPTQVITIGCIVVNGNITNSVLLVDVTVAVGNSDCSNQVTEENSAFLTLVKARSVTPVQARSVTASMMSFLIVTHTCPVPGGVF